jgi:hypothetical protein
MNVSTAATNGEIRKIRCAALIAIDQVTRYWRFHHTHHAALYADSVENVQQNWKARFNRCECPSRV